MGVLSRRRHALLFAGPPTLLVALLLFVGGRERGGAAALTPGAAMPALSPSDDEAVRAAAARQPSAPGLLQRTLKIGDAAGRPLAAAKVRVAFSQDGFQRFETLEVTPDAQGRLPLALDRSAWVVVSVHAPGYVPGWQPPITWGEFQDSEFDLIEAPRVDGCSQWVDGRPMAGVRLSFRPLGTPGEFASQVASKLSIVDEEVTTDAAGRFSCRSLRPGAYRVTFPDHPKWPALTVASEDLRRGALDLRARWHAPPAK